MTTWLLPVADESGDLAVSQGHNADATATTTVAVTASPTLAMLLAATAATTATVTAAASVITPQLAAATRTTTATITATATTIANASSLIVAGTGTYGPGRITFPNADTEYLVTVTSAAVGGDTPGVAIILPTPSTPNSAHWLTVTYTIGTGRNRRFYHRISDPLNSRLGTNFAAVPVLVEPGPTVGNVTTLNYTWDTTAHTWSVSSYSGNALVRDYGAGSTASLTDFAIPLFFSPEAQAHASFSTFLSTSRAAMAAIPSGTRTLLANRGVIAEVGSGEPDYHFEWAGAREAFDPATFSGIFGRWAHPFAKALPIVDGIPGQVILHELGHAMDDHLFPGSGNSYGVNPVGCGGDLTPATYYSYYPDGITVEWENRYLGDLAVAYIHYDEAGAVIETIEAYPDGRMRNEQEVVDLYATVADKPGSYYRSTITEWLAQCIMLCWSDHVSGYDATTRTTLINGVGGSTIFANFQSYAVSRGIVPSSW